MALKTIGVDKVPMYLALSSDVVDNKIAGATTIGKIILLTDTGEWKIILQDLTLLDYSIPSS